MTVTPFYFSFCIYVQVFFRYEWSVFFFSCLYLCFSNNKLAMVRNFNDAELSEASLAVASLLLRSQMVTRDNAYLA